MTASNSYYVLVSNALLEDKVVSFGRIICVCMISGRSISNDNTGKNVHICINDVNYIPIELIIGFLWYTNSTSIDSLKLYWNLDKGDCFACFT